MRLIVLNIWGGSRLDELADFVRVESGTTDIFCFQEVLDRDTDLMDYPQQYKGGTLKTLKKELDLFHAYLTEPYTSRLTNEPAVLGLSPRSLGIYHKAD